MAETSDFGTVIAIQADAVGQPGQRRFRLRALNDTAGSVTIWVEKEQLIAVGEAIESVLEDESYRIERVAPDDADPEPVFPLNSAIEFRGGQLQMGLNRETRLVVLIAAEAVAEGAPEPDSVSIGFDYRLAAALRLQITSVVAAGRPPCPLCTAPMDPSGHVCVRTNGHHPH